MELRHKFDLKMLLNHSNMARSSFYYYQKQSKLPDKYKTIKELIKSIYHKHKGRYGYRRITDELENKFRVGVSLQPELIFGRIQAGIHLGLYVYNPLKNLEP